LYSSNFKKTKLIRGSFVTQIALGGVLPCKEVVRCTPAPVFVVAIACCRSIKALLVMVPSSMQQPELVNDLVQMATWVESQHQSWTKWWKILDRSF